MAPRSQGPPTVDEGTRPWQVQAGQGQWPAGGSAGAGPAVLSRARASGPWQGKGSSASGQEAPQQTAPLFMWPAPAPDGKSKAGRPGRQPLWPYAWQFKAPWSVPSSPAWSADMTDGVGLATAASTQQISTGLAAPTGLHVWSRVTGRSLP